MDALVKKSGSYAIISGKIIENNNLTLQEKGLLMHLQYFVMNDCFYVDNLSSDLNVSKAMIYKMLKNLRKHGYVSLKKNSDGTTEWTITYE